VAFDPEKHHRRSIRLSGYDYAQAGAYFVTICAQNKACVFGQITDGQVKRNEAGHMLQCVWDALPGRFPTVELDAFVVMPNHIHGVVVIAQNVGATLVVAQDQRRAGTRPAPTLGDIVGAFKSITTHQYALGVKERGWPPFTRRLWQRNYYEHVIRNEISLSAIRLYIEGNPVLWPYDHDNPCRETSHLDRTHRALAKQGGFTGRELDFIMKFESEYRGSPCSECRRENGAAQRK
jgi:REP element-mobilizing transposase RayT